MKRATMIVGMLALVAALGWGQGNEKKDGGVKPISALAWLVGGTWTADASKLGPGMQRIETRYQWSDNSAYIRFNTHFVSEKGTTNTYDGQFFWKPAQKSLAMWYMDAQNGITEGPVEINGDVTKVSFRGPDFEGKVADLQVFVTRKTDDEYRWSVEEKQENTWRELVALKYVRTRGS
jgi:hypothetical protein